MHKTHVMEKSECLATFIYRVKDSEEFERFSGFRSMKMDNIVTKN